MSKTEPTTESSAEELAGLWGRLRAGIEGAEGVERAHAMSPATLRAARYAWELARWEDARRGHEAIGLGYWTPKPTP